jgi:hypothetical protein
MVSAHPAVPALAPGATVEGYGHNGWTGRQRGTVILRGRGMDRPTFAGRIPPPERVAGLKVHTLGQGRVVAMQLWRGEEHPLDLSGAAPLVRFANWLTAEEPAPEAAQTKTGAPGP